MDLYSPDRRWVHLPHFEEFAVHALRFLAPAQLGALVSGVPAAAPEAGGILTSSRVVGRELQAASCSGH
ncbi:MAG: hypothetical protein JSS97_07140 [Actinobacteria bacterium]|nr:hypothetical protein [Actinomycetota bacterium]